LFDMTRQQLAAMPAARILAEASARHPLVAEYATVDALLALMADQRPEGWAEREAMTRVFVSEYQRDSARGFWPSLLLLAYFPMLSHLRRRIVGPFEGDELDSLIITSFLQVAAALKLDVVRDRTALQLRQRTSREVFGTLRRMTLEQRGLTDLDPEELQDLVPDAVDSPDPASVDPDRSVIALLDLACTQLPSEQLELVVSTVFRKEGLRSYARRCATTNEPLERVYQRLKRRRTRAMTRLRGLLLHPPAATTLAVATN
jgi:hypothetical protein